MKSLYAYPATEPMTSIDISEQAILHNIQWIRNKIGPKKILALLKSNAYGHGLLKVSSLIKDRVDALGVFRIEDAVTLRTHGILTPILVMGGVHSRHELEIIENLDLSTVIHNEMQLELLLNQSVSRPISVWLKVDLGMNRLGFSPANIKKIMARLAPSRKVKMPLRILGHFSNADQAHSIRNLIQKWTFEQLTGDLNVERSLSNSAAIISQSDISEEWVRTGLLVYGVSPLPGSSGEDFGLKPAMNFDAKLIEIKTCPRGALVGYRGHWQVPSDAARIGVVGAGYGDGVPRRIGPETSVLVAGKRCRVVGNVCMNMFMVDLSPSPAAGVGDYVRIWGERHPVEKMAVWSNTIPNQLLVNVH
jgi:alanine racemase